MFNNQKTTDMNNEETILQNENMMDDEQTLLQGENSNVADAAAGTKKGGDAWKYAAGAIPGMVVGAGAVLAADAMASDSTTTDPTIPATEGEKTEGENAEQLKPADYTEESEESAANTTSEAAAAVDAQGEQGGADTENATPEEIAYAEEHNGALPYEGEEAAAVVNAEAGNNETAAAATEAAAVTEAAAEEAVRNVDVTVDGTDVKVVTADGVNVNIHINNDAAEDPQPVNGEEIGSGVVTPAVADVSDDMSFSEAFASARDQVGAGGVFHWRGGIYGTYYADEWSQMSAAEKNQFVDEARLEMKAGEGDPNHYLANHTSDENYGGDELQGNIDDADIDAGIHETSFLAGDEDIRIIGLDTIDVGNGQEITMGTLNVGGTDVALVDADGDGTFDFMAADLNDNGEVDPGEIVGINDPDASVENFLSLSDGDSILTDIELDGGSDIPADELYDL